jgi:hypothetical protein
MAASPDPSSSSSAASLVRAPLARLHALPPPAAPAAAAAPLPPQSARDFVPASDTRFRQHRCFPRLRDAAQASTDWAQPLGAFASRSCMAAAEGAEPTEPPLLRPADDYKLRYRPGRGPPPPPPPPPQAGAGDAEGNVR